MGTDLLGPAAMELLAAPAHQVVRLETVAEAVGREGVDAAAYPDAFARALEEVAAGAVGLKTAVAYRGGFKLDPTRPSTSELWTPRAGGCRRGAPPRGPVLLRHGIWTGPSWLGTGACPCRSTPATATPTLPCTWSTPRCSPTSWALGRCRSMWFSSTAIPTTAKRPILRRSIPACTSMWGWPSLHGARRRPVLAEALELAPFTKQLYSSDGFALAEFHYLGALLFRRSLAAILEDWVRREECSAADADRIAGLLGRDNAHRIYPMGDG